MSRDDAVDLSEVWLITRERIPALLMFLEQIVPRENDVERADE
jgi:hypothetical protein